MKKAMFFLLGLTTVLIAAPGGSPVIPNRQTGPGVDLLGRVETVGGTTDDYQLGGPMPQRIFFDSADGLHVAWNYSAQTSGFTDRNMRYNFYDLMARVWSFIDPSNFMNSGVNVFTNRTAFGNMDVNPLTGCAYVSGWICPSVGIPIVARDAAPGAGIFTECEGEDGYVLPLIALSSSGKTHVAFTDEATLSGLFYSGISPWGTWSSPLHVSPPMPDPGLCSYLIAASKRHPWVCIVWAAPDSESWRIYYTKSTDDGATWSRSDTLALPPAFHPGSDTVPSISPVNLYPWYDPDEDEDDALHVAVGVYPVVVGQGKITPIELWQWSETAGWSKVVRLDCDSAHLMGSIGSDAAYASRPSFAVCSHGHQLVCVWEQFDSANVEPRDSVLRADIWAARGDSLGRKWGAPVRLTNPDSTSKRFPCVAGAMHSDTFVVTYLVDSCAGIGIPPYGQGPVTNNPIVVQSVNINDLPLPLLGIAEQTQLSYTRVDLRVEPNPFRRQVEFTSSAPADIDLRLRIYDAAGRQVVQLTNDCVSAGVHHWLWRPNQVSPGIYFCELATGSARTVRKLTLLP
jgi:hypothetical protein